MSTSTVTQETVYASAARTATPTAVNVTSKGRLRLHLVVVVTALSATPSVVPKIDGYDVLSNSYYNLLTGVAITATGTTVLKVGPGLSAVASAVAADFLPQTWRLTMTHANADSITYSVAAHLAP